MLNMINFRKQHSKQDEFHFDFEFDEQGSFINHVDNLRYRLIHVE